MKPESLVGNRCLACDGKFDLEHTHCPLDGTPLVRHGDISIAPLDSQYEIEDIRRSRICDTVQLKARESEHRVIAKIFTPKANDERERERFKRIEVTLSRLNHPDIPRILKTGKLENKRPYILLEYKPGAALSDLLQNGQKIAAVNVCKIAIKVCEILEYAHRKNVIHPDLSPGDIIVEPVKTVKDLAWNVSLVDFGKGNPLLHSDNRMAQFTELGDFFGTPEFMPPEVLQQQELDGRANIYSLACIMYLAIKGQHVFKGATWFTTLSLQLNTEPEPLYARPQNKFQERLQRIVLKCLSKEPRDRYPSISDLKSDLQSLVKSAPQVK